MQTQLSPPSTLLVFNGALLMWLGLYFVFIRPPLLPEDPRSMGTSIDQIQSTIPGLLIWLRPIFWLMGGFMFTTGLLTTSYPVKTSSKMDVSKKPAHPSCLQ